MIILQLKNMRLHICPQPTMSMKVYLAHSVSTHVRSPGRPSVQCKSTVSSQRYCTFHYNEEDERWGMQMARKVDAAKLDLRRRREIIEHEEGEVRAKLARIEKRKKSKANFLAKLT